MIKKMGAKTIAILLSVAMVFTMMPLTGIGVQTASAASGNGGTVASNSVSNAVAAFGESNVDAEYNSGTLTITLNTDITLSAPVTFKKGSPGDKVVLDLHGNDITGANGVDSTDENAAKGKDAIQIIPADYDVEITGPGSVTGGKGAVFERSDNYKSGATGGDAVSFVANGDKSYWNPSQDDAELKNGLTISGGAVLTGGSGADLSGDDWKYNITYCETKKYTLYDNPQFILLAGAGGAGIGQPNTGIAYAETPLAYAKIIVDGAKVVGGEGGHIDMGTENTPVLTHYALMNDPVIDQYMSGVSDPARYYDNYVADRIKLTPGDGGDGIMIGSGRKFLHVKQSSEVIGGKCGNVDYGKSKLLNRVENIEATAGSGISVYGDMGLKNVDVSVSESNWSYKNENSGDVGIYIEGSVTGGDSDYSDALSESSGNAGNGITLNGAAEFQYPEISYPDGEDPVNWGIVEVGPTGSVSGGHGGTSVHGQGGASGEGINEAYTKSTEGLAGQSRIGTNYYIIKGAVTGGNGGDSMNLWGSAGGIGISFGNYRKDASLFGDGSVSGGDGGEGVDRGGNGSTTDGAQSIRFYPEDLEYYNNSIATTITQNTGESAKKKTVNNDGLIAAVSMTPFNDYPSTSTELSCSITLPSDYQGDVYVLWSAETKLQSNSAVGCDIEPSGTSPTDFNMVSNTDYKYLAYSNGDSNEYDLNLSTTDRITETISYTNSYAEIYCVVQLDDGRWSKSNVMHFTNEGWNGSGSGGGGDDPSVVDQQAVDAVLLLIDKIPSLSIITLEDEETIVAAREAYEALTDSQKELMSHYPYALSDLEAAERKIRELKGDDVNDILADIEALCDPDELSLENWTLVEDEANAISEIREKVKALTPEQQAMLASDENAAALAKFEAVDQKIYELVHGVTGSDYHDHLMQCVPEKAATCSTEGNSKYYRCMTCHELYGDKNGGNHITDMSSITIAKDPNAHVWNGGAVTQQPAVGVAGTRTYTCTLCGKTKSESIAALPQPAPAEIMDLPAVKISKPKAAKKKLTAKWKKVNKKNLNKIGGIEIQVAGPGVDKTVTSGKKSKSKKIGGLQSKQKYSVRVRAYKWIGGVKHVSKWSGWKSVKVK